MGKLKTALTTIGLGCKKYSPEILIVTAGIGTVAAVVLGCRATTKAQEVLEEHKAALDEIHEMKDLDGNIKKEYEEQYDEADYRKDLSIVYSKTIIKLVKVYGPTILTALGALFCMFASVNILRKRNAALAMACTTIMNSFADYRERVKKRYGEDTEFEIYNGIEEEEVVEVTTDKKGNEKTKVTKHKIPSGTASPFAICFDETNPNWTGDRDTDMCWLNSVQNYCTDYLISHGILFLNDVRKELGLEPTNEGQFFGWRYVKNNPSGDNCVDFRLKNDSVNFLDWMKRKNDFVMLNLNCDGVVVDYLPSCKHA